MLSDQKCSSTRKQGEVDVTAGLTGGKEEDSTAWQKLSKQNSIKRGNPSYSILFKKMIGVILSKNDW